MNILQNVDLINYNTLKISVKADYLINLDSEDTISQINSVFRDHHKLLLGEGSNVLFVNDWKGVVILVRLKGVKIIRENNDHVWLEVMAGENWHELVNYCVDMGWGGIENLALIPGTVGAAPVQNIAAYGQNFCDVCDSVKFCYWGDSRCAVLDNQSCEFRYRDSIFKHSLNNKGLVLSVVIKLNKNPVLETSYSSTSVKNESLQKELTKESKDYYSIKDVYNAVISIRQRQLPDWTKFPSAGSFFKNPLVSKDKLIKLQSIIPDLQFYPPDNLSYKKLSNEEINDLKVVKIPAGRLLDYLGWRGKFVGNCGSFEKHALILTHNGRATGQEMYKYVQLLQKDVKDKLDVDLEMEVVKLIKI